MSSLIDTIEPLLWEGEGTTLDFKKNQYPFSGATDDQKSEIIKDILAFANAFRRDDAHILLGVQENPGGRAVIIGVTHHLDDAHLQQLVNTKTNRTVEFSYQALTIDGQQVGAIHIPRQQRPTYLLKPYGKLQARDVYLRHGSSTSIASPEEIARMGADQHLAANQRHNPEIAALTDLQQHTRFYQRIVTLSQEISRIPHHYIVHIARPAEYEQERRALHTKFNAEHDRFRQAMSSGRDLLTQQRAHVSASESVAITEILAAMHEVEQTVRELASWANSRLDNDLPPDKKREAEQAANTLSTLVARRLLTLGAPAATP